MIAVAIIGVAIYMFTNAQDVAKASDEILERSQIESFNRFYYAYAPLFDESNPITGLDAYNIYNKVTNNNVGKDVGDYQYITITPSTAGSFADSENFLKPYSVIISADASGLVNSVTISE